MPNPKAGDDSSPGTRRDENGFELPRNLAHSYRHAQVIAAAYAAASWGRARLAALDDAEFLPAADAYAHAKQPGDAAGSITPSFDINLDAPADESTDASARAAIARVVARARALAKPIARWIPKLSLVALVLAAGGAARAYWPSAAPKTGVVVFESAPAGSQIFVDGREIGTAPTTATVSAGSHTVEFRLGKVTRTMKLAIGAGERVVQRVDWTGKPTGTLAIKVEPAGARVIIDGAERGVSPLTVDNLAAGSHEVTLASAKGSIERSVTIKAGETARLDEVIFAGWLVVFSPFDLTLSEGTRQLRPDDRSQVMLSPGTHEIRLENRALGYADVRRVDVRPGEVASLSVVPPRSMLTITASAPADVWVDHERIGQTPVVDLPVDLGTRDVVVRNAAGEERKLTVTVTVKPATLNVDFSKRTSNGGENAQRRQALN